MSDVLDQQPRPDREPLPGIPQETEPEAPEPARAMHAAANQIARAFHADAVAVIVLKEFENGVLSSGAAMVAIADAPESVLDTLDELAATTRERTTDEPAYDYSRRREEVA